MADTPGAVETRGAGEQRDTKPRGLLQRLLRFNSVGPDDEAYVKQWKDSWTNGANARWRGSALDANPHGADSRFAAAWTAGWRWAEEQPDRREPSTVRFAVPQRRATDRVSALRRSRRAGAVGLSAIAVAAWLWRTRSRRS